MWPVVYKLVQVMLRDVLYAAASCLHGCDRLGNALLFLLAIICCMVQIALSLVSDLILPTEMDCGYIKGCSRHLWESAAAMVLRACAKVCITLG